MLHALTLILTTQLAGEIVDKVEMIGLQRGIEVLVGDLGDPTLELADAARGEPLRHQRAQSQMAGVVERQE